MDPQPIVSRIVTVDFPWDVTRALELALLRTFAVPAIAELLGATGEFEQRTQRRYDDTAILVAELLARGYDSDEGRRAISVMNRIHRRFAIHNDEFIYVLSTFMCEPPRWIARYGWRGLSDEEMEANFRFWQRVGEMMNISGVPASYADMDAFNRDYEARRFGYSVAGARIARVTMDLMLDWYLPRALKPLARPGMIAIFDEPLRQAFAFARPPAPVVALVEQALRTRARVLRLLPRRRRSRLPHEQKWRSYPRGYEIESLGAAENPELPARWRRRG
jgi:ER-bound oxygenase mpaB/B'/Rubber oxygenase, catalytic domain